MFDCLFQEDMLMCSLRLRLRTATATTAEQTILAHRKTPTTHCSSLRMKTAHSMCNAVWLVWNATSNLANLDSCGIAKVLRAIGRRRSTANAATIAVQPENVIRNKHWICLMTLHGELNFLCIATYINIFKIYNLIGCNLIQLDKIYWMQC